MSDISSARHAEEVAGRDHYEWLIGATVVELGFTPGSAELKMIWVEKGALRAMIRLERTDD